ncbi:Aldo/keto reductase family-domain-containing protein [Flagelloscypha sp. PMI_526]|nr:Aldo/keto reductase family-domain-containing protein [Flagelloscypha sp. PMI_526]
MSGSNYNLDFCPACRSSGLLPSRSGTPLRLFPFTCVVYPVLCVYCPALTLLQFIIGGAGMLNVAFSATHLIFFSVSGAAWYVFRLSRGPTVIWSQNANPEPYSSIKQNQTTKLMNVNPKLDGGSWSRGCLMHRRFGSTWSFLLAITFFSTLKHLMASSPPLDRISGPPSLPSLVFGGAAFSHFYNDEDYNTGDGPVATVRAAMRAGITAFDTSVYYGDSEIVLGNAFQQLKEEYPRETYTLVRCLVFLQPMHRLTDSQLTKCGRYSTHFDYSPQNIRRSVLQSLSRFHTEYLDVVYLHDIEFVATVCSPRKDGVHTGALSDEQKAYGLIPEEAATIQGEGDQAVVDAWSELVKLKTEGKIRHIGITGYPLPTLLRVSLLLDPSPDVIMSYSHLNLQNRSLLSFLPAFRDTAKIPTILSASPLNMGLLTPSIPTWHPAPEELRATMEAFQKEWNGNLPELALMFGMETCSKNGLPLVVGLSNVKEVETIMAVWARFMEQGGKMTAGERQADAIFKKVLDEGGWIDWSWASGSS